MEVAYSCFVFVIVCAVFIDCLLHGRKHVIELAKELTKYPEKGFWKYFYNFIYAVMVVTVTVQILMFVDKLLFG